MKKIKIKENILPLITITCLLITGCNRQTPSSFTSFLAQNTSEHVLSTAQENTVEPQEGTPQNQETDEPLEMIHEGDPVDDHPIEKNLQKKLSQAMNEGDVRAALAEARDEWYKEIKKINTQVLQRLKTEEERKLLKKNIEAWEALSDSEDRLISEILNSTLGSSSITQLAELAYQIPRERVVKLKHFTDLIQARDNQ